VLETRPGDRLRNGGETAIVEWMAEKVAGTDRSVIVLYENGRVPTIVRNQSLEADIDVLTIRRVTESIGQPVPPTSPRPNGLADSTAGRTLR